MEYNLAIKKKKEILTCAASWINRDNIKLTASQIQSSRIATRLSIEISPTGQPTETENRWVPGHGEDRKGEKLLNGYWLTCEMEMLLEPHRSDCANSSIWTKRH